MPTFRQLKTQDVRDYWADEAREFTPWVADDIQSEQSSFLEDILGLDLELVATERHVGRYQLDVLAEVSADGRTVVIENQLTSSDHDHLGKSIAYAAGIDADIIVWIAPQFYDEHVDAAHWLNKNSREGIDIFAVELNVVTIGNSDPAVQLSAVAQPSEWTDRIQRNESDLTQTEQIYEQFWTEFRDRLEQTPSPLRPRQPPQRGYYDNPMGHSDALLSFAATKQSNEIACILTLETVDLYEKLSAQRDEIESEFETDLDWRPPADAQPESDRSRIKAAREGDIFVDEARDQRWEEYHTWFIEMGTKFHEVFRDRI